MAEARVDNVPRGLREDAPKRPALEDDVYERIRSEQEKTTQREFVRFAFYAIDPAWRRLDALERAAQKRELVDLVERHGRSMMLYSYSLAGTRGDADFLLCQATREFDRLHELASDINHTAIGAYLRIAYSYFAMTRRSLYTTRYEQEYLRAYGGREQLDLARIAMNPQGSKYLFVYPFVKTREWYALSQEERQRMMDEHIHVGHQWPDVKINTTYSYGLDDQEFVMAFETDYPGRFVDLLMALRMTAASKYTLRDTPSFSCIALGIADCLEALG